MMDSGDASPGPGSRARPGDEKGYFPRDSILRSVGQEALGLLGGGRAILLQLAHPLVAAGVADHSDFQTDPLTRLLGTLELMHAVVHSGQQEADRMLRRFHAVHARIRGHLPHAAGRFPTGTPYCASDPRLKLWVHATLIDTSLITYQRFVKRLTGGQRRRLYADACILADLMGIPEQVLPPSMASFHDYMAGMLAGDTLAVTDTSRRLAWEVLHPQNVGAVAAQSARLLRIVTAGLLPARFRREYGLAWGTAGWLALGALSFTTRRLRPIAPSWVWQSPLLGDGLPRRLLWGATRQEGEQPIA